MVGFSHCLLKEDSSRICENWHGKDIKLYLKCSYQEKMLLYTTYLLKYLNPIKSLIVDWIIIIKIGSMLRLTGLVNNQPTKDFNADLYGSTSQTISGERHV